MRAQEHAVFISVKSVPHVTGRVVRRYIEVSEVKVIRLHFWGAVDLKSHIAENLANLAQGLVERMQAAALHSSARQGYVNTLTS